MCSRHPALQETLSSMSVSILYSGIQNRTQSSRQGLTSAKQRAKNHFSQPAGYTLASAAQDGVDLQDALLTHIGVFLSTGTSRTFYAVQLWSRLVPSLSCCMIRNLHWPVLNLKKFLLDLFSSFVENALNGSPALWAL